MAWCVVGSPPNRQPFLICQRVESPANNYRVIIAYLSIVSTRERVPAPKSKDNKYKDLGLKQDPLSETPVMRVLFF